MSQDLVAWLLDHYGQEQMRPGLERIRHALRDLLPQFKNSKIVTIAGTNGKGETTLRLASHLEKKTFCAWISPHIERVTERFVSEEGEISEEELAHLIQACHEKVQTEKYQLTFYEFLFFVFCTWANKRNPAYLLLEVGLGGRLDAVNVFDADLVLLPSLSRDHQELLGRRYDLILKEKWGVLRPGKVLMSYMDLTYLRERAKDHVEKIQGKWIDLESLKLFPRYEFSSRNQLLAYAAFLFLEGTPLEHLISGEVFRGWSPRREFLEHRGEVWKQRGEWIFFGSHNPDGLRKLIQFLHSGNYNFSRPPYDQVIVAFSRRSQEDLKTMIRMLKESGLGKLLVTTFTHPKSAPRDEIEGMALQEGLDFVADIESHVQGTNNCRTLVAGSYYFLGDIQSRLLRLSSADLRR